ncbi:Predicted nitric oxide reductase activation protein [gamma proteobacterium HdN1]|nr:Predicted nitric oxide reductase activation protein [gamma proteobacterium HdN1]
MEEWVGGIWDRFIRRAAHRGFPSAAVELNAVRSSIGPYFRALGGNPVAGIKSGSLQSHGGPRRWLERVAGTGMRHEVAWIDAEALYLPEKIDHFAEPELNRELYFWLAALAAFSQQGVFQQDASQKEWPRQSIDGWQRNVGEIRTLLAALPGLRQRYMRLVQAHLPLRPAPESLSGTARSVEVAVRNQLLNPDQEHFPVDVCADQCFRFLWPVALWLRLDAPSSQALRKSGDAANDESGGGSERNEDHADRRFRARDNDAQEEKNGMLMLFRAESVFSWEEYVRVNRPQEEDEDTDDALLRAKDMETLTVSRSSRPGKSRVRFDLDLPASDMDDTPLGPGLRLPEWDYRKQQLIPEFCCLEPLLPKAEPLALLPLGLRPVAARLRRQFESLVAQPGWRTRCAEGEELDMDACLNFLTDLQHGGVAEPDLWRARVSQQRSLACLLLADISLSTDTWVGERRVIDVVRDSLFLFAEAMSATRDAFGIYGFSSVKRQHVRYHLLKDFSEPYGAEVRGRIQALKPGFYTRFGAAIRHSCVVIKGQAAEKRLLLVVTDGKPNDLDHYEGRYGIEDTRQAVIAAREMGITVFCVTIDKKAADYLPYVFGSQGFVMVENANDLPRLLPRLYVQLTRKR